MESGINAPMVSICLLLGALPQWEEYRHQQWALFQWSIGKTQPFPVHAGGVFPQTARA